MDALLVEDAPRIVSGWIPSSGSRIESNVGWPDRLKDLCHLTHGADFRVDHEVRGLVGMLSLFQ